MADIDGIPIYVIQESHKYDNDVSSHPVESRSDVTDHVERKPVEFSLTGEYAGPDAANVHRELIRKRYSGDLVEYKGRGKLSNAVILSFQTDRNSSIANGFTFSMTLRQVSIARSSSVNLLSPNVRAQVKEVGNAGRVQVI